MPKHKQILFGLKDITLFEGKIKIVYINEKPIKLTDHEIALRKFKTVQRIIKATEKTRPKFIL